MFLGDGCLLHSMRGSRYEENPNVANESSQVRANEETWEKYLPFFQRLAIYYDLS